MAKATTLFGKIPQEWPPLPPQLLILFPLKPHELCLNIPHCCQHHYLLMFFKNGPLSHAHVLVQRSKVYHSPQKRNKTKQQPPKPKTTQHVQASHSNISLLVPSFNLDYFSITMKKTPWPCQLRKERFNLGLIFKKVRLWPLQWEACGNNWVGLVPD